MPAASTRNDSYRVSWFIARDSTAVRVDPTQPLAADFFVPDDEPPPGVTVQSLLR
jgi:hypothetical protein